MLKLVVFSAICLGLQCFGSVDAIEKSHVLKGEYSSSSSSRADASSEPQFHCHKRASGYYADPRFQCEVFHYCHTDGTRVTIPCGKDNQKHRICFLKDIAAKACDGSELFLPLPEDLFFKPSKDTTASAFNGATEFKLPEVLPEPAFSSEISPSTTPLSSEDEKKDGSRSLLSAGDVSSIYEVFNSFLKEIETRQDIDAGSNSSPRPRPSTFSRRSRLPSSLEQKDALVDVSPSIERRIDVDSPFLVEVYNDDKPSDDNDYSSYRRKSKKLFFTSDKKTPAKHPRRKRTVPEQQSGHRPYAIVYAKVPDTTMADSLNGFSNVQSPRQESISLPFAPALVPENVPVIPITIETRRKKKSKKKNPAPSAEISQQGQQQVSEQQNVYYYTPDQISNVQQLRPDGRAVANPQQQVRGNSEAQSSPQSGRLQPVNQPEAQNTGRPAPYSPQNASPLQLPNFPFQTRPLVNNEPRQPSYFFGPQEPFGSPFGPLDQFQSRPPFIGAQRPESQQGFRPANQGQPPRNRQPSDHPSGSQVSSDPNGERVRDERPSNTPSQQGYPGFQNPFFDGFSGFGSAPFNGPFTPQNPSSFSLIPPQQFSQQLPGLRGPQQPPERYNEQTRPQYSVQEIPQSPQGQVRPENIRQGISVPIQPSVQELSLYGQDRTRQPNRNVQSVSSPERPPRMNVRPTSQNSPSQIPGNQESLQLQPQRRPSSNANPAERGRPEQFSPYDPRLYQPAYSPENVNVRPERPSIVPTGNGVPNERQSLSRPTTVLVEDYRPRGRPRPQTIQEDPRDTMYIQRQPAPERNRDERQRQPERERGSSRQPERERGSSRQPEHERGSSRQP
ncbi:uncharacterized protein NPIL_15511, partial [Nephila pilipes]